jgi:nitrile hydratase accessory protein
MSTDARIGLMDGAAALPRSNGELVFEAPWEGRAFGIAVALNDVGLYDWDEFRERLIAEIDVDQDGPYYERWLSALEKLIVARGFATPEELDVRTREYATGERDDDHDD